MEHACSKMLLLNTIQKAIFLHSCTFFGNDLFLCSLLSILFLNLLHGLCQTQDVKHFLVFIIANAQFSWQVFFILFSLVMANILQSLVRVEVLCVLFFSLMEGNCDRDTWLRACILASKKRSLEIYVYIYWAIQMHITDSA